MFQKVCVFRAKTPVSARLSVKKETERSQEWFKRLLRGLSLEVSVATFCCAPCSSPLTFGNMMEYTPSEKGISPMGDGGIHFPSIFPHLLKNAGGTAWTLTLVIVSFMVGVVPDTA